MAQLSRDTSQQKDMTKNWGDSIPVDVERIFRTSMERLWEAWSAPELMKQWWGPEGYSCPEAKIDFREGGKNLLAMQAPDGKVSWSGGTYQEIVPNEKIVCTDEFTDEKGNPVSPETYGMAGDWGSPSVITVTFDQFGEGEIRMTLHHEGIPREMHDDCVRGWDSSFNKLQNLVERI